MNPYQCRRLTSFSNGNTTLESSLPAAWLNAGAFPLNTFPRANSSIIDTWSGGCEDRTNSRLIIHGAGHNDSPNNAVVVLDCSGNTEPVGFSTLSISTPSNVPYVPSSTASFTGSIAPGSGSHGLLTASAVTNTIYAGATVSGTSVDSTTLSTDGGGSQGYGTIILPYGTDGSTGTGGAGTYAVTVSQTVSSEAMTSGVTRYRNYADGLPEAVHSYYGLCYDAKLNQMMRFGGAPYQEGGVDINSWAFNLTTLAWTQLASMPFSLSASQCFVIFNEYARKVLVLGLGSKAAFYRVDANTWSSPITAPNVDGYPCPMYDFRRGNLIWAGTYSGTSYFEISAVNWTNETLSNSTFSPTGSTAILLSNSFSGFYDYWRDSVWMYNALDQTLIPYIYEMPLSTYVVTQNTLTGDSYSVNSSYYQGGFNRQLFMPGARAVIFVAKSTDNPYAIKLPAANQSS